MYTANRNNDTINIIDVSNQLYLLWLGQAHNSGANPYSIFVSDAGAHTAIIVMPP